MEEIFSPIKSIGLYIKKFKELFRKYKLEKGGYRYSLVNVTSQNNEIDKTYEKRINTERFCSSLIR